MSEPVIIALGLVWFTVLIVYRLYVLRSQRPYSTVVVPGEEFVFRHEIVAVRRVGQNFTFRYLGTLIDVLLFRTRKRHVLALRIHRPFPENLVIRKNYSLLAQVSQVFPVKPWRQKSMRARQELVVTNSHVSRQLSRIPEFEVILINKETLIAGRYIAPGQYDGENLSLWASALYNLHLYASKVLAAADFPMEPVSISALCPFCREEVSETESQTCDRCGTFHHPSCWQENRGCAVFGCYDSRQQPTGS